jgi:hypothetical protein
MDKFDEFKHKTSTNFTTREGLPDSIPALTRASTYNSTNKPPPMRKYYRESSVGAKLRYNFSKENLTKNPKFFGTKHNFSDYSKIKNEVSLSHKEFKPPRGSKQRRNSYAGRKFIDDR